MLHKKATIGLSVETLVVVIISLVVLAGGVTLIYKFISGAEENKALLDEKTNAELERLLVDEGKEVALPRNVATVERGNNHVFGIGILNVGAEDSFSIEVEFSIAVDKLGNELSVDKEEITKWVLYDDTEPGKLAEGQHDKISILVKVPKEALVGQYIFNVKVKDSKDAQYGNTQKFTVEVK
ncbi:hypothetical protein HZC30_05395 [Candidatus Woesearchaeota archaeon]|nr:hypothetical protein [Candidatus Woesearchaeota archaeon]